MADTVEKYSLTCISVIWTAFAPVISFLQYTWIGMILKMTQCTGENTVDSFQLHIVTISFYTEQISVRN